MYFFVPYQLTGIQQAIQAGHAALEYARKYFKDKEFQDFVDHWKTWIILNGGTTNSRVRKDVSHIRDTEDPYEGSLDNLYVKFIEWNITHKDQQINHSVFIEPDLNDALTAVCFICDERVFNYESYIDFENYILTQDFPDNTKQKSDSFMIRGKNYIELKSLFPEIYTSWIRDVMGSEKNVFIRGLLKGKKLA